GGGGAGEEEGLASESFLSSFESGSGGGSGEGRGGDEPGCSRGEEQDEYVSHSHQRRLHPPLQTDEERHREEVHEEDDSMKDEGGVGGG
ncbi:hypothetical protein CSUI_011494, partial [Cystoisospora suis]